MHSLTIVILTKDEAANIRRCIESVKDLGPVLVVDTGSTDSTIDSARSLGARVESIAFEGFGKARRRAVDLSDSEYVLCIDADEVVTPNLAGAIKIALAAGETFDCYALSRLTNFCGKWVMSSGWYPEHVVRLFRREKALISDDLVHESISCGNPPERLGGLLLHFSYDNVTSFRRKMRQYSLLGAERYVRQGGKAAFIRIVTNPVVVFLKKFLLQRGYLEGIPGLWIAVLSAAGQFCKYLEVLRGVGR